MENCLPSEWRDISNHTYLEVRDVAYSDDDFEPFIQEIRVKGTTSPTFARQSDALAYYATL